MGHFGHLILFIFPVTSKNPFLKAVKAFLEEMVHHKIVLFWPEESTWKYCLLNMWHLVQILPCLFGIFALHLDSFSFKILNQVKAFQLWQRKYIFFSLAFYTCIEISILIVLPRSLRDKGVLRIIFKCFYSYLYS